MKAVILARGLGTRMREADDTAALSAAQSRVAESGVKTLVPLSGERTMLDYILSSLADAGCTSICLVIGPEHDAMRGRYAGARAPSRFSLHFAVQEKPLGTGDALYAARTFAGGDEFLMTNSDNYYPVDALRDLVRAGRAATVLFTPEGLTRQSNIDPSRILKFALGRIGRDGCLDELIEKPDAEALASLGSERHVSMNCWRFESSIFDACASLTPSKRGELELTDAIMKTIAAGVRYKVFKSGDGVLDLSRRGDVSAVNAWLKDVVVSL